jgi:hypothetical protein
MYVTIHTKNTKIYSKDTPKKEKENKTVVN